MGLGVEDAVLSGCDTVGLERVWLRFLGFCLVGDSVVGSGVGCAVSIFSFLFSSFRMCYGEGTAGLAWLSVKGKVRREDDVQ